MMKDRPTEVSQRRRGERGAALVTSLLVAMLMLAAGGALIASAGMTASNTVDATAEAQAYYAADSGIQAALTALRRNKAGSGGLAANFHNFACGATTSCVNDGYNLAAWLDYEANGRVTLSASPDLSFAVTVTDPSLTAAQTIAANYTPRYLLIRSVGRGPKGATKVLEMMADDFAFDFTARAAVAVRSNDNNNTAMGAFSIGNSSPHLWNGNDGAGLASSVAAFAVTNSADYDGGDGLNTGTLGKAERAISNDGANVIGAQQLEKLDPTTLESWLQDADQARAFISAMRAKAEGMGRFNPSSYGTNASPKFSFVDGNVTLNGSSGGAGLLIVTGKYTQGGSAGFNGIVLALGDGVVDRNGTPGIGGALVVAKFEHTYDEDTLSYTGTSDFLSPSVTTSGGGNSLVGYNSEWVRKAMESLGARVLGVVEK
ncbi:MAG TPA: hypothetical protein VF588_23100 [Pyrinomonadaceae bacterium]|jgi:hypothetical protein